MSSNTIVKDTAVNKPQLLEVHNQRLRVYNNQTTQDALDVNLTGASGAHGLATETTLDSFRTENASNLGALDSSLTDGTAVVKCMGLDGATPVQLKVASDGALHIISENADSMLIKGVETGTTTQRDCKQNANGDLRVQLIANDGNDGAGTMRIVKCDANGVLDSSGGGGGGGVSETDGGQSLVIADATQESSNTITTSGYRELSISIKTNNMSDMYAYLQYSRDNATWYFVGYPIGEFQLSPDWSSSEFIGGLQLKANFPYYRVFKQNTSGGSETCVINYAMKS